MKNYTITKNAMKLLSRLVLSCCHPLMNIQRNRQNQNAVIFAARKNEDVCFGTFSKSIAANFVLYEKLWQMAQKMGKDKVDQEAIINYFGSKMHIDKVMDDLGDKNFLSPEEFEKFLFLHMLIPGTVEWISQNRMGIVFRTRDTEVRVRNIIMLADDAGKVEIGSCVLTHFATLVSPDCDKLLKQHLLSEEAKSKEFLEAAKYFNGREIDPGVITENTEKLVSCYNL
jgi:hypothetical protein